MRGGCHWLGFGGDRSAHPGVDTGMVAVAGRLHCVNILDPQEGRPVACLWSQLFMVPACIMCYASALLSVKSTTSLPCNCHPTVLLNCPQAA
jgi:hypothetical protein